MPLACACCGRVCPAAKSARSLSQYSDMPAMCAGTTTPCHRDPYYNFLCQVSSFRDGLSVLQCHGRACVQGHTACQLVLQHSAMRSELSCAHVCSGVRREARAAVQRRLQPASVPLFHPLPAKHIAGEQVLTCGACSPWLKICTDNQPEWRPLLESATRAGSQQSCWLQVDVAAVDAARFPLFLRVPSQQAVLRQGDLLHIPKRYWHFVTARTASISVNYWFT